MALPVKDNIGRPHVLRFLRHLHRAFPGPVVVLPDQGRSHRATAVRHWPASHPSWHVIWLPPYAPELNATEQLRTYLKYGRFANLAPKSRSAMNCAAKSGVSLRGQPCSAAPFRHSALSSVGHYLGNDQ